MGLGFNLGAFMIRIGFWGGTAKIVEVIVGATVLVCWPGHHSTAPPRSLRRVVAMGPQSYSPVFLCRARAEKRVLEGTNLIGKLYARTCLRIGLFLAESSFTYLPPAARSMPLMLSVSRGCVQDHSCRRHRQLVGFRSSPIEALQGKEDRRYPTQARSVHCRATRLCLNKMLPA